MANHNVHSFHKSDLFYHLLKEALVRFVGFGAEEDEWVNVKDAVRERSVPLENSECNNLKAGDLVCCFQVILVALFCTLVNLFIF